MTQRKPVRPSDGLANVRYEIRGKLARRALALELSHTGNDAPGHD
jgi:hypothetical protein